MSGHSKWHNIQKTKGAADAKRSAAFTKVAKEIIVAVKTGGSGDPNNNSRLATVIAKAKAVNMPNDNIKRTIDKALGANNTDNYESVVYEGYGPNGVAVIVEALTDNRQPHRPGGPPPAGQVRQGPGRHRLRVLVLRPQGRHHPGQRGRRPGRGHRDDGRSGLPAPPTCEAGRRTCFEHLHRAGRLRQRVAWPPWRPRAMSLLPPRWRWCPRTMSS